MDYGHFPGSMVVKNLPANTGDTQEMQVQSLVWEGPLEKEMATHSSILAWKILWTEEPGELVKNQVSISFLYKHHLLESAK